MSTESLLGQSMAERKSRASMGPSTNVDGESRLARRRPRAAAAGFNGAVDECRRRAHERRLRAPEAPTASMGPSTNVDGELPRTRRGAMATVLLQWGRRRMSTERV